MTEIAVRGAAALNRARIGEAGSRGRLETPALVLDLDRFERNAGLMAALAKGAGIGLRPHAKTHKCAAIARRQLDRGALGIACAKPGELLALFEAGIAPLMLTAPVASAAKVDALARAAVAGARLSVVCDRLDLVAAYGEAAHRHGAAIDVLADVEVGLKRTGLASPDAVVALALEAERRPGLRFAGVQAYAGQVQHIADHEARRAANGAALSGLEATVEALRAAGLPPEIVSGGGTGSHRLDLDHGLLTEIQAGSYIFVDEGYRPVDLHGTGAEAFETSLFVAVTVIAHSAAGRAIVDAGSKSFAIDGPPPRAFRDGALVGTIEWCGDEFGRLIPLDGHAAPPVGTLLDCTVPHCDPTVNLHDVIHIVQGDRLVDLWPVEGRGRSD